MPHPLKQAFRYHAAISYAGEDAAVARAFADYLRGRELEVFFAEFARERLLGEDLQLEFHKIFMSESERAIVVVSENFIQKVWTLTEFAAVRAAILQRQQQNYLIAVRMDDTVLPGLLPQIGYADIRWEDPAMIGATIVKKCWPELRLQKAYEVASPWSEPDRGRVTFNYRDFDGRYRIGSGLAMFETYWTAGGADRIHCYANQTPSITAIALVPAGTDLYTINDGAALPPRNKSETPLEGQSVVLRNDHGFYAGLTIVDVTYQSGGDATNTVTLDYVILKDGGSDFKTAALPVQISGLLTSERRLADADKPT